MLGIGDDDDVLEIRRQWYQQFTNGDLTLAGLEQQAPLIGRAVKKRLDEINGATLEEAQTWFDGLLAGTYNLKTLRHHASGLADQIDALLSRTDSRVRRRS